ASRRVRRRLDGAISRSRRKRYGCASIGMAFEVPVSRRRRRNSAAVFRRLKQPKRIRPMTDPLRIADTTLSSRLFVGTAGYPNQQILLDCLAASRAEIVTVSLRGIS